MADSAPATDTPILELDEAAALLKVSTRWLQRSRCPRVRVGRIVRYDREQVLDWFRAQAA